MLPRHAAAQGVSFPADARVRSVLEFGAIPNDNADDTAAFQAALNATVGTNTILYVPDGVYNLSDSLNWGGVRSGAFFTLQGQSQAGTILKLADNAAGFDGANGSTKVFVDAYEGNTANAFRNYLQDLTIDVGNGNPGVVGLQFQSNNTGRMQNVTIRSAGPGRVGNTGLNIGFEIPGPFLAQNITIEGFNTGIVGAPQEYSVIFENLTLRNQNQLGIYVWRLPLQIRNLTSVNAVPVLSSDSNPGAWGHVVIDGGTFTVGSASNDAVVNRNSAGVIVLRNVTTNGYRNAVSDQSFSVASPITRPDGLVSQFTTDAPASANASPTEILNIPVEDAPAIPEIPLNQWVSVTSFGAIPNDNLDDTDAVQAAMSSGAPVVYFPTGSYYISRSITVGPNVQRIEGLKSDIITNAPLATEAGALFRIPKGSQPVVHINGVNGSFQGPGPTTGVAFEQATANTLVIRDGDISYRNTVPGGKVFLENVVGSNMTFTGQRVWARQLNPEGGNPQIINDGGDLYILGLKTEGAGTALVNRNRARSVIMGGLIYPATTIDDRTRPMIVNENSSLSFSLPESSYINNGFYAVWVRETRNGVTTDFTRAQLPLGRTHSVNGGNLALYNGYQTDTTPPSIADPTVVSTSLDTITLSWPASTDAESGIARYNIYRDGAFLQSSMTPAFVDSAQPDGTARSYQISAVNGAGLESPLSDDLNTSTNADTVAPRLMSAFAGLDPRIVSLTFSKPLAATAASANANYSITGPAPVTVLSAAPSADGLSVTLTVTPMSPGTHTIALQNLADRATAPNTISGTAALFAYANTGSGTGLSGSYYNNRDFAGTPLLTRLDATVDFDWNFNPPAPGLPRENFAVRWVGQLRPKFTETYTIFTRSDDGMRVFIDGRILIDQWVDQGVTEVSRQIVLDSSRTYDIVVDYYQGGGGAEAHLSWQSASQPKQIIPASALSPTPSMVSVRTGFGSGADAQLDRYGTNGNGTGDGIGCFHSPASGGFHSAGYYRFDLSPFNLANNYILDGVATLSQTFFGVGDGRRQINFFGVNQAANGDNWMENSVTWDSAVGNDNSGGLASPATATFIAEILLDNTNYQNNNRLDKIFFSGDRLLDFIRADTDGKVTFLYKRVDPSNEGQSLFSKEWLNGTYAPALRLKLAPRCPLVLTQPIAPGASDFGPAVTLFTIAQGAPPLAYQWRRDGVPLTEDPSYHGVNSPALTITNLSPADAGAFDVVITNACGTTTSAAAQVTVSPPPCPADFNADGVLNSDDLSDFITGYFDTPPDPRCDFNTDGVINADDLGDFITAYFNGCG